MSFLKKFFQKIKSLFIREVPLEKQPETTITVTRLPIIKPKKVKIEKPKRVRIKKEKIKVEKRLPKVALGFRCTLAINYVVHHRYYSMKLTYYTHDANQYYRIREDLEDELKESVEREVGYSENDWWFPNVPSEEITLTRIPRELIGKWEIKQELVKIGKRAKTKVKAK